MKKLRTLLLILLLAALSANAALGEGLNGLADLAETPAPTQAPAGDAGDAGGLAGLYGLMPVPSEEPEAEAEADPSRGILPDPQDLLGTASSTIEDYAFSEDYRCSVYYYPLPADDNAFLLDYTEKARERGFSVEKTALEGYDAWKLSYGDLYAMLVPQYMGVTLLLAENGMRMGDPLPEGTYLRVRRNGVLNEKTDLDAATFEYTSLLDGYGRLIEIDFTKGVTAASEYAKLDLYSLTLGLQDLEEGAQYEFNRDFSPESDVVLITDKDGDLYHVYHAAESVYNPYNFFDYTIVEKHNTAFKDEQDFFRLNITSVSVTKNEYGQIWSIEGTFEGRFNGGALNYTDGSFRVNYIP